MPGKSSLAIGQFLYKNAFPIYDILYPIFKKWQDAYEIELLKRFIKKGDTVLDIGANIGFYAEILADIVGPEGKIYSFEPDPQNLKHLNNKVGNRGNVTIVPKAVSAETGVLKLYISSVLNVDHRVYPSETYNNVVEIDAVSIDDFMPEDVQVDFMKMDIQGAEISALRGMEKVVSRSADLKILMEFWPFGLRSAGNSVREFLDTLEAMSLYIYMIEGKKLIKFDFANWSKYADLPYENYYNLLVSKKEIAV